MSGSAVVEELLGLYSTYGASDYIGEEVTQLQHALQAAEQAKKEGCSSEIILGAFFHDIGHLLGEKQVLEKMVTGEIILGVQNHAEKGKEYLESMGLKGHTSELVGMHVQAKRYLVATTKDYYDNLSDASKMTLEHQGGPMSEQEVKAFTVHPLKDVIIRMRRWDEQAKDPEKFLDEEEANEALEFIIGLLYKQLGDKAE